jgi:hypothetical protein
MSDGHPTPTSVGRGPAILGGISVVERGLAFGSGRAGMRDETPLAAVLVCRLSTFPLPTRLGILRCSSISNRDERIPLKNLALNLIQPSPDSGCLIDTHSRRYRS